MRIVFIFLLTIIASTVIAKQPHVKKVTAIDHTFYKNKHGKKRENKKIDYFIVYDSIGREIQRGRYGQSTCSYREIHIDSTVQIATGCSWDYSKISDVKFYSYDSSGKKTREDVWNYNNNQKDRLLKYTLYTYNVKDFISSEIVYDAHNKVSKISYYKYDTTGNNVGVIDTEFQWFGTSEILVHKIQKKYDKNNRLLDFINYSNEKLLFREQYRYDENGNVTKFYYDGKDTLPICITEKNYIDDNSKKLSEVFEKYINLGETREIYTYNTYGLKENIKYYDKLELEYYTSFEYEYYP